MTICKIFLWKGKPNVLERKITYHILNLELSAPRSEDSFTIQDYLQIIQSIVQKQVGVHYFESFAKYPFNNIYLVSIVTLHTTYGTTESILRISAQRAAAKAATDSESFMIYGIFAVHTLQDRSRFFVDCLQKRYSIAKKFFSNYVYLVQFIAFYLHTVGELKDCTVAQLNFHLTSNFRRLCKIVTCTMRVQNGVSHVCIIMQCKTGPPRVKITAKHH